MSARIQFKRDREVLDLQQAVKVMGLDWQIEPIDHPHGPDFSIYDGCSRFGLEHTLVCFDWASRSEGSRMRASEMKRHNRIVEIVRRWEERVGAPLNLSVSSRRMRYPDDFFHFDTIHDDELLHALLRSPVCSSDVGIMFHVLLGDFGSGEYTDLIVRKGLRPLAEFIPSHMGWVSRDARSLDSAIEEKSKKLSQYRNVMGADVRLLLVADWTRNSGKVDVDPTLEFDLRGFTAVYFSTGAKAFEIKALATV